MLGWFISVYLPKEAQKGPSPKTAPTFKTPLEKKPLIRWATGISGDEWIRKLCREGKAINLGGDGYPFKFTAQAKILRPFLLESPPHPSLYWKEFVESELPISGGEGLRNSKTLKSLEEDQWLVIEVFDQS